MSEYLKCRSQLVTEMEPFENAIERVHQTLASANLPIDNAQEIREEIEGISLSLRFASLFASDAVCTIAGPQGVGKSSFANLLLGLPEDACLITGPESCEHIPVLIKNSEQNVQWPVEIHSLQKGEVTVDKITYEEGRRRVVYSQPGDLFAIWNVQGAEALKQLSPVMVLPGIQEGASFNRHIETAIANSDLVMIVVNHYRSAQADFDTVRKWTETYKISHSKTLMVGTFIDCLNEEKRQQFSSTIRNYGFHYLEVTNDPRKFEGEPPHEAVYAWAIRNMCKTSVELLHPGLKKVLNDSRHMITRLDRAKTAIDSAGQHIQEEILIDELQAAFNKDFTQLKDQMVDFFSNSLNSRAQKMMKKLGELIEKNITEGLSNRCDLFFSGNTPQGKKVRGLAYDIKDELLSDNYLRDLYAEVLKVLARAVPDGDLDDESLIKVLIASILTSDVSSVDTKPGSHSGCDNSEVTDSLNKITSGLKAAKGILNQFGTEGIDITVEKTAGGLGKVKLKNKMIPLGGALFTCKQNAAKTLLQAGIGTGGAAQAGLEMAGAGFAGMSMTVMAGVIGGVVAIVVAHSLISNYRKGQFTLESSLHDFYQNYIESLRDEMILRFDSDMNKLRDRIWYSAQKDLEDTLGLQASQKDRYDFLRSTAKLKLEYKKVASTVGVYAS